MDFQVEAVVVVLAQQTDADQVEYIVLEGRPEILTVLAVEHIGLVILVHLDAGCNLELPLRILVVVVAETGDQGAHITEEAHLDRYLTEDEILGNQINVLHIVDVLQIVEVLHYIEAVRILVLTDRKLQDSNHDLASEQGVIEVELTVVVVITLNQHFQHQPPLNFILSLKYDLLLAQVTFLPPCLKVEILQQKLFFQYYHRCDSKLLTFLPRSRLVNLLGPTFRPWIFKPIQMIHQHQQIQPEQQPFTPKLRLI